MRESILSARNLIWAAVVVVFLAILGIWLELLSPPDSDGRGTDSYGTHGWGYRALFEFLPELGIPTSRAFSPLLADSEPSQTVALLEPNSGLLGSGPKYVAALLSWVEAGGRLVVTPCSMTISRLGEWENPFAWNDRPPASILKLLELEEQLSLVEEKGLQARGADEQEEWDGPEEILDHFWSGKKRSRPSPQLVSVSFTGELESLQSAVQELAIPSDGHWVLKRRTGELAGGMVFAHADDAEKLLAAVVRRGRGEIVVLSAAALFTNGLIAQADNSVLAAHLLSPAGRPVLFDEFFHGLSVRGNAFYLLTRLGFASMAVGLALCAAVWTWRAAIFLGPPQQDDMLVRRRSLAEYLDAMARFLSRASDSPPLLAHEIRAGVLRELSRELNLPQDTSDTSVILAALRRRAPARATQLEEALAEADAAFGRGVRHPRTIYHPSLQRLTACL